MGAPLELGHARTEITPELGIPMGGYAARGARGCEEVEDPLFADVLVLRQGGERIVLAALDVVNIEERWGWRMREGVGRRLGLPPERVIVLASHTHFGPATGAGSSVPVTQEKHRRWADRTVEAVIDAAVQADARREPVTLHVGRRDVSPMVYNRRLRRPDGTCCIVYQLPLPPDEEGLTFGPVEPNLTLLRFDGAAGKPALYLVSAAIHPVVGGGNFYGISADYPGVLRQALERAGGAPAVFALGTAANLVPIQRGPGQRERIGRYLAGAALEAAALAQPTGVRLAFRHERIELPAGRRLPPDEMAKAVAAARARAAAARAAGASRWEVQRAEDEAEHLEALRKAAELRGPGDTVPFEISAIALGDLGILCLPGEIFAETGLHLQARSPFPKTLVLSLANQATGYLPTRAAMWAGGYEMRVSQMSEESEEAACAAGVRLLLQVWEAALAKARGDAAAASASPGEGRAEGAPSSD